MQNKTTHHIAPHTLPCCNRDVRLYVREADGIHLHERTCKSCGRVWTFATECRPYRSGWSIGTSLKLGKPTLPAVEEVLLNRDEDGWFDAHDRQELLRLSKLAKAGKL